MTDYRIEAATKEEWAERALRAEAKLAAERERCAKVAGDAWMDGVPIAEIPAAIRKGDTP